jgi:hypothetical protein
MEKNPIKTVLSKTVNASSIKPMKTVVARSVVSLPTATIMEEESVTINVDNCNSEVASETIVTKDNENDGIENNGSTNDGITFSEYLNGLSNEILNNKLNDNASTWWAKSFTFVRDQVKKESYNMVSAAKDLYRQKYNIEGILLI